MNNDENKEIHLRHEWFVVHNPTPSEVEQAIHSLEHYKEEQDSFDQEPGIGLPKVRRGTRL